MLFVAKCAQIILKYVKYSFKYGNLLKFNWHFGGENDCRRAKKCNFDRKF